MVSSSSRDLDVESRLRRREVVADLARDALVAEDLDRVLDDVVTAARETLACGYCGAFESLPGEDAAVRRAADGRRSGPDSPRVSTDDGTLFEEVLGRDEPVVVDDLAARGGVPDDATASLVDRGLAAAVGVRVGPVEDPWGVLVAAATEPGAVTVADGEFLRRVGEVVASAVEGTPTRTESVDAELEEIYGRISDAFFALDEEWRFTYLNERAHDLINPEGRSLVGENVWEVFPEAVGREFEAAYERAMYEQETVSFEEYYPEPLDTWFEVRAYPSETGLSVYFRDVTERKERERELERFEILFEESTDVNAVLDADGTYQYLPPSAEHVLGYEAAELEGEVAFEYIHPDDREAIVEAFERLLEDSDYEPTREFRYRHADGSWIWLEATGRNLLEEPHIEGVVVYTRDVTERREYERQLEESEQRYRALAEHFPNGLVTLYDEDLRYTLAAGQAFEYLPMSAEDLDSRTPREVWGEDAGEVLEPLLSDALDGQKGAVEVSYFDRDWLVYAVPVTDDEGEVFAGMTMAQDVTERKVYERQLEESERRYRTLAEHFPNGAVGVYDEDLRYTLAEGTELGGVLPSADELEGGRMPEIFPAETVTDLEPIFRAAVEDGETDNTRTRFGGRYWRVWATPLHDSGGEIFAGLSFAQDVTEQVERERRLERFETIVETVDDGVYVVDEDGYFTMVNEAYAELLGYPREDLVGMHVSTIVDNDVLEDVAEMQAEMEAGNIDEPSLEAEILTASGEPIPAAATFALLPEDDDRWHRVGVVRDISDRKEGERRLAESERRYRTLVENFPDGAVAMFDEEMEYSVAGGQLLDAVGLEESDRVGNSVYDIYPEEIVEEVEPYFEAALEGETNSFEVAFHDRHLFANTLPVRNAGGEIFAGMLVVQDVTERREYERELETRARQQQAVAELGQYALEVDDLDEFMAEAARRVADVLGNDYCKVLDLDPDNRELLLRQGVGWDEGIVGNATVGADEDDSQAGYTLRSEEPVVVEELETETRFGGPALLTSHDVSSGISTVIGSLDDPWGILGTHDTESRTFTDEDVNFVQSVANILAEAIERHQYQAELEALVERLEESNERLEQFAYAASHDLQEPLRMVSSYLQLVEKRYADRLDDEAEEFIEFAVDGAERMREMIDALLAYSRVETRGDPFEPVDLEAVLADVRDDLQVKIRESDAEITVEPLPTVSGDRDQLRQVFQNLLDNAIEYSGEAPPRVDVDAERGEARRASKRSGSAPESEGRGGAGEFGDDQWVVSVADEGIGIPPENAETVFEVFQRLHSREEHAGTGIGLALCERIVERHGGDIWVESEPGEGRSEASPSNGEGRSEASPSNGEGSTFYFTLPAGGSHE